MKLAVPFALVFALSACTSQTAETPLEVSQPSASATRAEAPTAKAIKEAVACPPTPIDVAITYEISSDSSGGVTIDAASNLPDGALMGASFFMEGGYFAQDEGVLKDGKVSFGPFLNKGEPLKGAYDMSITLPIARNQPDSIKRCIGEAGELLTGPLLSTEEVTGDKVASVEALVTVG